MAISAYVPVVLRCSFGRAAGEDVVEDLGEVDDQQCLVGVGGEQGAVADADSGGVADEGQEGDAAVFGDAAFAVFGAGDQDQSAGHTPGQQVAGMPAESSTKIRSEGGHNGKYSLRMGSSIPVILVAGTTG
ncbi:hypothetical protein [Nocardia rhamnosiphila]